MLEARTLCATHWAALQSAATAAAAAEAGQSSAALVSVASTVPASLLLVADTCPGMVAAGFLEPAHSALAPLARVSSTQLPAVLSCAGVEHAVHSSRQQALIWVLPLASFGCLCCRRILCCSVRWASN